MKDKVKFFSILILAVILCNIILFVIPVNHNNIFWMSYIFTMLAMIVQFFIWNYTFVNNSTIKSKFTGLPIIAVSSIYITFQLVACLTVLMITDIQSWVAVVIYASILFISLMCLISTDLAGNEVTRMDITVNKKTDFINSIRESVEILIINEESDEIKSALTKLAEQIKYSDPVSSDELFEVEIQIKNKIEEISISANKLNTINEIEKLIIIRNTKCKNIK